MEKRTCLPHENANKKAVFLLLGACIPGAYIFKTFCSFSQIFGKAP